MKYKAPLVVTTCLTLVFCGTQMGFAASKKSASPSPSASASPAASAAASPAAKSARAIPFHGNATAVDQSAKTFTIGSRVFKVTDQTTVTKGESSATLSDLTDNAYVTGSYMKQDDGSLEAKSVKIGGKTGTQTGPASKKAKKDDTEASAASTAASPSPSASPKKKK
jgi:hypothetical protein